MLNSNIINLLPLVIILVMYFTIAFVKPILQSRVPFRICAICGSVSFTWLALLVLRALGVVVSTNTIGILMGMSVVGIMYKMEEIYKKKKIKNFWFVRLVVVIGGFYLILSILDKELSIFSLLVLVIIFSITIPTLLLQGITHEDVVKEQVKAGTKASLIKKLDNCC